MNVLRKLAMGWAVAACIVGARTGAAQDLERGRMLHENHCRMCHDSIAYNRGNKIAKNRAEVKAQVVRWQTNTGLRWSEDDIDNVAAYLAERYYHYPAAGEQK
jgi:mono/diheme cytochrome c family protein